MGVMGIHGEFYPVNDLGLINKCDSSVNTYIFLASFLYIEIVQLVCYYQWELSKILIINQS